MNKHKNIVIDADGCPVVRLACRVAKEYNIRCSVICDSAHIFSSGDLYGASVHTVSQGADSADMYIVNHINENDVVITQDYGLAAMCLAKRAVIIDQNGRIYSDDNISMLLESRAANKRLLRSGKYPKGAKKRTSEQDKLFEKTLRSILKENLDEQI